MAVNEIYGTSSPYEYIELNCSKSNFEYDVSTEEHVADYGYYNYENSQPYFIRWKSGKRVDPRLLALLESFKEVYEKRKGFFKKIFPGFYDEFVDVYNKFNAMTEKNNEIQSRTLERSSSFGSFRGVKNTEEGFEFKLEAFKVKAPKVIIVGSGGGQGAQTNNGVAGPSKFM